MKNNPKELQRPEKKIQASSDIYVTMTWHCGICKENWKEYTLQSEIRKMPSYILVNGKRCETRRPDGSMLRAHDLCARKILKHLKDREISKGGFLESNQPKKR